MIKVSQDTKHEAVDEYLESLISAGYVPRITIKPGLKSGLQDKTRLLAYRWGYNNNRPILVFVNTYRFQAPTLQVCEAYVQVTKEETVRRLVVDISNKSMNISDRYLTATEQNVAGSAEAKNVVWTKFSKGMWKLI